MALTPEDVINKRFQPTKFREGYDQDEVDDFLDEVVGELRRLNQENEDLRKQLEASGTAGAPAGGERTETAPAAQEQAAPPAGTTVSGTPEAPQEASAAEVATGAAPAGTDGAASSAAGVLAMAQKLHDEYVAQGHAERERLITEGRSQADQLVSEGKRTKEETLSSLESEKIRLEASVEQLRSFESDYRSNLKDFINGQLREIDSTGSLAPAGVPSPNSTGGVKRAPAGSAE